MTGREGSAPGGSVRGAVSGPELGGRVAQRGHLLFRIVAAVGTGGECGGGAVAVSAATPQPGAVQAGCGRASPVVVVGVDPDGADADHVADAGVEAVQLSLRRPPGKPRAVRAFWRVCGAQLGFLSQERGQARIPGCSCLVGGGQVTCVWVRGRSSGVLLGELGGDGVGHLDRGGRARCRCGSGRRWWRGGCRRCCGRARQGRGACMAGVFGVGAGSSGAGSGARSTVKSSNRFRIDRAALWGRGRAPGVLAGAGL
ncbi:hypothetical protein SANTM175S_09245 [Streptomyces antimycoticus]